MNVCGQSKSAVSDRSENAEATDDAYDNMPSVCSGLTAVSIKKPCRFSKSYVNNYWYIGKFSNTNITIFQSHPIRAHTDVPRIHTPIYNNNLLFLWLAYDYLST